MTSTERCSPHADSMTESEEAVWDDLCGIPADPPLMRQICGRCQRPSRVCWCPFLPQSRVRLRCSRVVILQHPAEQKRCLRTAPMLELALDPAHCTLFRGKRFPLSRHAGLSEVLQSPRSLVLYPSQQAVPVEQLPQSEQPYTLVVIDGTWAQAKSIFHNTAQLHRLTQVRLPALSSSEYVIRTQPTEGCLSTLEAVCEALCVLEARPELRAELLRPLHALCDFQLGHGAVPHHSKQLLLGRGEYRKPVGRRTRRNILGGAAIS